MAIEDQPIGTKLRVFVSYSRQDASALTDELAAGLTVAGFEPSLDRADIAGGEEWELRLAKLIAAADTVVFLLSPASVNSTRCKWEVETAEQLSKRIVPVVAVPLTGRDGSSKPSSAELHFLFRGPFIRTIIRAARGYVTYRSPVDSRAHTIRGTFGTMAGTWSPRCIAASR